MQTITILLLALIAISQGYHVKRSHKDHKKTHVKRSHKDHKKTNSLPRYDGPMPEEMVEMYHDELSCKDEYSNCPTNLKQYCQSHDFVRDSWCRKSCGTCAPDAAPAYVTAEPQISDAEMENIKATCLAEHNAKRNLHRNTPSMTYDMDLAKRAQTYAEYLRDNNQWKHDAFRTYNGYETGVGENLYWSSSGSGVSSNNAVASWYNEIYNYNFATGTKLNDGKIGHFTQLVWDSSTKLGCGVAKSAGGTYVVSRYLPAGNTVGQYTQHVHNLKAKKDQQDPPAAREKVL